MRREEGERKGREEVADRRMESLFFVCAYDASCTL